MTNTTSQYLYEQRDDRIFPSDLVRGPWAPGTQNGAMVAGLLAHVLEQTPVRSPHVPMDLQIHILKPIPLQECRIERRVVREGQKLQIVQATLLAEEVPCAQASLVRLRHAEGCGPVTPSPSPPFPAPEDLTRHTPHHPHPYFEFIDCRFARSDFEELEPGAAWFAVRGEIVLGQGTSPLGAAMLCADAGSGLAAVVPRTEWGYPNVSLSLHSHRAPQGEWLLLESETVCAGNGVAQVNSRFSDRTGLFGHVHQAVILEQRR